MTRRRTAMVTGASRGIGRYTALALARAGYDVAFTARTVVEGEGTVPPRTRHDPGTPLAVPGSLATTAAEIEALGVRAVPIPMDLADQESVRAAAAQARERLGGPDIVVNNAIRHVPHARLADLTVADLYDSLTANLVNQVVLVQELLPAMLARGGGLIVNMASGSATTDPTGPAGAGGWGLAYSAAKAGFGRLAGAINVEYADRGIRAFNLDPGFVVTESGRARGGTDQIADQGFTLAPIDGPGRCVLWLATSPEAAALRGRVVWGPKLLERIDRETAT